MIICRCTILSSKYKGLLLLIFKNKSMWTASSGQRAHCHLANALYVGKIYLSQLSKLNRGYLTNVTWKSPRFMIEGFLKHFLQYYWQMNHKIMWFGCGQRAFCGNSSSVHTNILSLHPMDEFSHLICYLL
jgi:hypothetical protein